MADNVNSFLICVTYFRPIITIYLNYSSNRSTHVGTKTHKQAMNCYFDRTAILLSVDKNLIILSTFDINIINYST
jgi:hypothetical protein